MNEQIRKFSLQAGATLNKGYIELSDGQLMLSDEADVDHTNMDLEKFAELIIKDCIEQCEAIGYEWHKIDTARASGKKAGAFECAVQLREYFEIK